MTSVKINCPRCSGLGLEGTVTEKVCTQCTGKGTITVNDSDSIATVSAASTTPIIVTAAVPTAVPAAAIKVQSKGKN